MANVMARPCFVLDILFLIDSRFSCKALGQLGSYQFIETKTTLIMPIDFTCVKILVELKSVLEKLYYAIIVS